MSANMQFGLACLFFFLFGMIAGYQSLQTAELRRIAAAVESLK